MIRRRVRVLQVIDTLGMGGAETWLMALLRLWSDQGRGQVDFLITSGNPGALDAEARDLGATIHYERYSRSRLPAFARRFRRILTESRYDAIHDHQDYASGWHFAIGRGRLPPVRVTHVHNPAYQIHNNYGVTPGRRLIARAGRQLVRRYATHIAATSQDVLVKYGFTHPSFDRIPKGALHCGFATGRFRGPAPQNREQIRCEIGLPASATIVLYVGRLDQSIDRDHPQTHKNSGFAIRAFAEAARLDALLHMAVAGARDQATQDLHVALAESLGVGPRVHFLGVRQDVERLMLGADLLLFPSREEGLGMVAVEAQAAGLPVLASTGVPRECVVVPELVRFLDVDAGPARWGTAIAEALRASRPASQTSNDAVSRSPFAIEQSAGRLERLYLDGEI
jgi:glycosyltransferase involved in cell wall biosynthesis